MTRYATTHKRATRDRILDGAHRLFKRGGIAATGVDAVMGAAGLTVGGFYAHFASKDDLVAEALRRAVGEAERGLVTGSEGLTGLAWLRAVAQRYLGRAHRDAVEAGCPLPPLSAEVSRLSPATRRVVEREYVARLLAGIEASLPADRRRSRADRAVAILALWIGGVVLARLVTDEATSDRVLDGALAATMTLAGAPARSET